MLTRRSPRVWEHSLVLSPSRVRYSALGPLEVVQAGEPLRLCPKTRTLLGVLLVHANEPLSQDRLIEALWPVNQPASRHALQMQVSRLRTILRADRSGPLVTLPHGYLLRIGPDEFDVHRFDRLAELGQEQLQAGHFWTAAETLRQALHLWRGQAYEDLCYEASFQLEIERLNERRFTVLEARLDADLATGRHKESIAELQALVGAHPFREKLTEQLMLALYRSGRQADALRIYRECRRGMLDALAIEPGTALRELHKAILRHAPELNTAQEHAGPAKARQPHRTATRFRHHWACTERAHISGHFGQAPV